MILQTKTVSISHRNNTCNLLLYVFSLIQYTYKYHQVNFDPCISSTLSGTIRIYTQTLYCVIALQLWDMYILHPDMLYIYVLILIFHFGLRSISHCISLHTLLHINIIWNWLLWCCFTPTTIWQITQPVDHNTLQVHKLLEMLCRWRSPSCGRRENLQLWTIYYVHR